MRTVTAERAAELRASDQRMRHAADTGERRRASRPDRLFWVERIDDKFSAVHCGLTMPDGGPAPCAWMILENELVRLWCADPPHTWRRAMEQMVDALHGQLMRHFGRAWLEEWRHWNRHNGERLWTPGSD